MLILLDTSRHQVLSYYWPRLVQLAQTKFNLHPFFDKSFLCWARSLPPVVSTGLRELNQDGSVGRKVNIFNNRHLFRKNENQRQHISNFRKFPKIPYFQCRQIGSFPKKRILPSSSDSLYQPADCRVTFHHKQSPNLGDISTHRLENWCGWGENQLDRRMTSKIVGGFNPSEKY